MPILRKLFASSMLLALALPVTAAEPTLEQWRAARAANLSAPNGWLSLVALQWLPDGDTTVGSAPGNKLRLQHLPAHALTLQQHNGTVTLAGTHFDPCLKVNGQPAHPQALGADDSDKPGALTCNGVQMTVIHRGDRLYLRVKDSAAPTRTAFKHLNWFAPNTAARITARWVPYSTPHTVRITNVLGQKSEEKVPGYAEFSYAGHTARLDPLVEGGELFFIFRDETRHDQTYGAGRFLYTALPDHGLDKPGTVVLDFNRAQNPPCAYSPYATCPLPPTGNRLSFAIPAGEKRYRE